MKILIVEDDPASLKNAKLAVKKYFGDKPEVKVVMTVAECANVVHEGPYRNEKSGFDLVMTDMHLPVGREGRSVCYKCFGEYSAGLVILLAFGLVPVPGSKSQSIFRESATPCLMVTDSNGHDDPLGLLLEIMGFLSHCEGDHYVTNPIGVVTRPDKTANGGKDWQKCLGEFLEAKKILSEFRIDL